LRHPREQDGVDVINYSVGSSAADHGAVDPLWEAFKGVAAAGVFVSASAGNSGPGPSSMGSNGEPWVTTIAAGTHPRKMFAEMTLSNANAKSSSTARVTPASNLVALPPTPLYLGTSDAARLCAPGSLDPAEVKGKVVICVRGTYFMYQKGDEVTRAGGVGIIIANAPDGAKDLARFVSAGQARRSGICMGPSASSGCHVPADAIARKSPDTGFNIISEKSTHMISSP
jgi:hypothetical protein